jgi:hypothetical protein
MKHRTLLIGLLALFLLAGCQNMVGPVQRRLFPERVDDPCRSIDEQEKKGRERLALPERPDVAPRTYAEEPSLRGYR